jgi:uncharacterized protein
MVKCPTCEKDCEWNGNDFRPFCSDRCRLIDLGMWMDEGYRVAVTTVSDSWQNEPETDEADEADEAM